MPASPAAMSLPHWPAGDERIMSIFTSLITETLPVPHDPGQSITIRKLAPRALERAAKAQRATAMQDLKDLGGPAFMKELQTLATGDATVTAATDPLLLFDRVELNVAGLVSWTYDQKPERAVVEDLDEETTDWLARAILKLSRPALFQTADEAEAAQKNG